MKKAFLIIGVVSILTNQGLLGQEIPNKDIKLKPVSDQGDPKQTEVYADVPVIKPGTNNQAPSDAIVLFDGKGLDEWTSDKGHAAAWEVKNGIMTVVKGSGSIFTKRTFADCQLHVEWRSPEKVEGDGQGRGNSGVYLQGRYEVQVLDSYNNPTYSNGQAGSIYKQYIPMVNASLMPGEWQTYDIIYTAPRFNVDSSLKAPAYITVFHNGVVIQNHVEIKGSTTYIGQPKYQKHLFKCPLMLQEHGCAVSYRNIWVRELNVNKLFNHNDTKGWYTFLDSLGKNNDPEKNFTIENNVLHIMGKNFGYLCTEKSFSNYHLKVVFKWGTKQFAPREKGKRDSGILYYFDENEKDMVWPKSIECQVQEEDCGDFWCVGTGVESANKFETAWGMKHIFRSQNFENTRGEWNTIEIIANGNQVEHYVNGHLVNSGWNTSVSKGKILLQSEGAEVFYKDVELMPY
jgi:hypothetical protein